ncbi:bacteriophage antitermination protein Q [Marinobacter sp. 1Y8]
MKSARRAWHDAYYIPMDDRLAHMQGDQKARVKPQAPQEPGQEYSRGWYQNVFDEQEIEGRTRRVQVATIPLMNVKDGPRRSPRDFFERWDPIWRSKVQRAIKSLSKDLQAFGTIMYSPTDQFSSSDCERVHELVQRVFFNGYDKEDLKNMRAQRIMRLKFLIYAAMRRHREVVFGGKAALDSPKQISRFLYCMYMIKLPSVENWSREWERDWIKMLDILDSMEKKALRPVSKVLSEMEEVREVA